MASIVRPGDMQKSCGIPISTVNGSPCGSHDKVTLLDRNSDKGVQYNQFAEGDMLFHDCHGEIPVAILRCLFTAAFEISALRK